MARLWFTSALLPEGWAASVRLTIREGLIAGVESDVDPDSGDERHGPAIPGLPNLHSHTFQRAMAGRAERGETSSHDDFWTWREAMYRSVERLGPDDVEAVAAFAFVEMLETGFTRVGEFHYLHHDASGQPYANRAELATRIIAAAATTGIGLTLLPSFYAHASFGGVPPTPGQRRFVNDVDGFTHILDAARRAAAELPGTVIGIAPHSLRAVTPDELSEVVALAGTGPVHIHVAEQLKEVDDGLAWSGRRPVEWLLEHQPVDDHWCLIHATHTNGAERREIATRGVVVGLCPITEANLGDGIFDAHGFQRAGGRFGVGTDSNVLIDAGGELRQVEYSQRLSLRRRNVIASESQLSTGRALFDEALGAGSQALGVAPGGLVVGQSADFMTFAADHPTIAHTSVDGVLDAWIFASRCGAIDRVWARGREVVLGGRHVLRDSVEQRFRDVLVRCWHDM